MEWLYAVAITAGAGLGCYVVWALVVLVVLSKYPADEAVKILERLPPPKAVESLAGAMKAGLEARKSNKDTKGGKPDSLESS